MLKLNVDGAFDAKSRKGGVGLVIRDNLGNILEMQAIPIPISPSAESVEALVVRFALILAANRMEKDYIVEGDAQTVIRMLKETSNVKASLEVVIKDAVNLVSRFNSCSFNFVLRACNRVEISLAIPTEFSRLGL